MNRDNGEVSGWLVGPIYTLYMGPAGERDRDRGIVIYKFRWWDRGVHVLARRDRKNRRFGIRLSGRNVE